MSPISDYRQNRPLNPLHATLLGFPAALFATVLAGDVAVGSGAEQQWAGIAFWLIVGGLLPGGLVLLWVVIGLVRAGARLRRSVFYAAGLLGTCALGLINAVAHANGAQAGTPAGIGLSAAACGFALVSALTGYLGVPRDPTE